MSIVKLTLPEYTTTLPISGAVVTFRPFVTREEKILLLAQEEGNSDAITRAVNQIINICTFEKYNISNLNKLDAEFLFLQLRNKSFGETIEVNGICKACDKRTRLLLNLDNVKVSNPLSKEAIQLGDDLWVTLRLPTMTEAMSIEDKDDITAAAYALDTIITQDNSFNVTEFSLEDRVDFIHSLVPLQRVKLDNAFEAFPKLTFDTDYKCVHCGADNNIHVEGLDNFFG